MKNKRRPFSKELKHEILEALKQGRKTIEQVEQEYKISRHFHIARWKLQEAKYNPMAYSQQHHFASQTKPMEMGTGKGMDPKDRKILELTIKVGQQALEIDRLRALASGDGKDYNYTALFQER